MASPVDAGRATTNSTTSGTSHSLNLPGSIAAGDVLVAIVRCPASTTIAWPAGWTEQEQSNADASDDETSIAFRLADGTEGATITITLGTSRILVGLCYRVTGAAGISFSAVGVGSGSQPNGPLIGTWPTSLDLLVLSMGGCDDSETLSSAPTNYVNGTVQGSTATGTSGCTVYGASRQVTAASEDPGAWALSTTSIWTAWSVALSDIAFPSRMTQLAAEALLEGDSDARLSQLSAEALLEGDADARLSQLSVEALIQIVDSDARLSAFAVEVIVRNTRETWHAVVVD